MKKKLTIDNYSADLAECQMVDLWGFINSYIDNFERPSKMDALHYSTKNIAITIKQTKDFVIIKIIN